MVCLACMGVGEGAEQPKLGTRPSQRPRGSFVADAIRKQRDEFKAKTGGRFGSGGITADKMAEILKMSTVTRTSSGTRFTFPRCLACYGGNPTCAECGGTGYKT